MRNLGGLIGGVVLGLLSLALMGVGCWNQSPWTYGLGLVGLSVAAAVLVRRRIRGRIARVLVTIGTTLVVLMAGFGIPGVLAGRHGDTLWQSAIHPDGHYCYTRVITNRLYASECDGGIDVLDPSTGNSLWRSTSDGLLADGSVVSLDYSGTKLGKLEYRDPDGRIRWSAADAVTPPDGGFRVPVAARNGTVVTLNCAGESVTDCTYIGTGPDGKPAWRKQLPGAADVHAPDTAADLHQPLPEVLTLVDDGRDSDRFLAVDPVTGRTRLDLQLPRNTHVGAGGAQVFGDQVLLPTNDYADNRCAWTLYQGQQKLWTTTGVCEENQDHQVTGGVYRVTQHLIYVGMGDRLAVINRQTGRSRVLSDGEALLAKLSTLPDPLYDRADLVSDRVIISFDRDQLRGTDPMTGRQLWTRDLYPGTEATVGDAGSIALTMPGQVFNPMAHSTGDRGARTIEVLDPGSGRTVARAFEPDGLGGIQVVDGRGALITPASDKPSYLVGPA
jgi:hypothetical protein